MSDNQKNRPGLDAQDRVAFLEALIRYSEEWSDNSTIFVEHLDDLDPKVRATAIRGLWDYPDPALIDKLMWMANQDPDPEVRARAISGLGVYVYQGEFADYEFDWGEMTDVMREDELPQADFERVKAFLLDVYADEKRTLDEQRFAIESLGFVHDAEIVDLVEQAYHRPEREIKISALFAMGRSGMDRWLEILERELHNDDPDIQLEAIRAVGEIGFDELGKELLRLTYSEDPDIRLEAIFALGQTGWEEAFERLDDLSMDPDGEIAETAQAAMDEWLWIRQLEDSPEEPDLDEEWEDDL